MPMLSLCLLAAIFLTGCSNEPEYTEQQRGCIAKQYQDYDRRQMRQCVDVCRFCMGGNMVTCSTSCKLKGAT
jgi:PBP1b-binding outer membrane lipoprotein LpoB